MSEKKYNFVKEAKKLGQWINIKKAIDLGIKYPLFTATLLYSIQPVIYYKLAYEYLKKRGLLVEFEEWAGTDEANQILDSLFDDIKRGLEKKTEMGVGVGSGEST